MVVLTVVVVVVVVAAVLSSAEVVVYVAVFNGRDIRDNWVVLLRLMYRAVL